MYQLLLAVQEGQVDILNFRCGNDGQATMNTTLDHAQLQLQVKALRDAVVRADLEPAAKQTAIEVANG